MIVMKFGGTSIGTASQIRKASEIISSQLHRGPIVVVSALSGVTNTLISFIDRMISPKFRAHTPFGELSELKFRHQTVLKQLGLSEHILHEEFEELTALLKGIALIQECTPKTRDRILAFGEHCSSKIVSHFLSQSLHQPTAAICSYDLGLRTNSRYGQATPIPGCYQQIKMAVQSASDRLIVTTGFIAKDEAGNITTLGRSGSDYSASLIGAAIGAEEIQIWTDVNGVMTADPRIIPDAKPVTDMTFQEASELAYYGAKVIHPTTMIPAMQKNIPVRILNTNRPEVKGTTIFNRSQRSNTSIKSIASRSGLSIINITSMRMLAQHGFLAKIFDLFARHEVVVDSISTSEVSVSVTTDEDEDLGSLLTELRTFSEVTVEKNKSVLSVVGEGVIYDQNITGRVFSLLNLSQVPVRMISLGASKINLNFIVDEMVIEKAIAVLHHEFFS